MRRFESSQIDLAMELRDEQETFEAHKRRATESQSRSILRDENVTTITLEG